MIDTAFLLLILLALFKGWRQGLVVAVFSLAAFVIGLAAAIKLSDTVAGWLEDSHGAPARWIPVLAFAIVFIAVAILVRWGARLVEKALDLAMMGWLNKLGGVLLYATLYAIVLSIILFYCVQIRIIPASALESSLVYPHIRSWGPAVIEELGQFIPVFKGMFGRLEDFFGRLVPKQ